MADLLAWSKQPITASQTKQSQHSGFKLCLPVTRSEPTFSRGGIHVANRAQCNETDMELWEPFKSSVNGIVRGTIYTCGTHFNSLDAIRPNLDLKTDTGHSWVFVIPYEAQLSGPIRCLIPQETDPITTGQEASGRVASRAPSHSRSGWDR